jgi:hypothetical protein
MFNGYVDALNRFETASKTHDPVATSVPLFEALNWAVALDDRTAAHFVPDGKHVGYRWRERIPNAEFMGGVRFARNSVHHQWSDALQLDVGARQYPRSYPLSYFEWTWRPAAELPTPDRPPRAEDKRIYEEHMEGRAARIILDVLAGVFYTLQHLLELHTIRRASPGELPAFDDYVDPSRCGRPRPGSPLELAIDATVRRRILDGGPSLDCSLDCFVSQRAVSGGS